MKMKSLLKRGITGTLVVTGSLFFADQAIAQIKVGDNPTAINANAVLDVESTTKGILFPRVALTGTANPAPLTAHVVGMQVYNTAAVSDVQPGNYVNDGVRWVRLVTTVPESAQAFGSGAPSGACTSGTMYSDTLESSATLGQQWTCSGGVWVSYVAPNSTPFYINGTTNDAGSVKTGNISRLGGIVLNNPNGTTTSNLAHDGGINLRRLSTASSPHYGGYIDFTNSTAAGEGNRFRIAQRTLIGGEKGALALQTYNTPRLVVATNGNIGINTTEPEAQLHVKGLILGRLEGATGNVNVGTSTSDGFVFSHSASNQSTYAGIQSSVSGVANLSLSRKAGATVGTTSTFIAFNVGGDQKGTVALSATGVAYNATSDRRLKENIKTTHYTISDLMKINVVDYNYKSDNNKTRVAGFIAQDLHKIFPDAVTVGGADVKNNPWFVDYSKLTPLLVKAVQDQQNKIASLEAQLAEMNSLKNEMASIKAMLGNASAEKATEAK